jgi:hypothetical protein
MQSELIEKGLVKENDVDSYTSNNLNDKRLIPRLIIWHRQH